MKLGINDRGKHTLSLEPSTQDRMHERRYFIPLNSFSMHSCYSTVNATGGLLFKNSTSIYDCLNPQVNCTPLLAIFTRVRGLEDGTGIKVTDWTGKEEITVKILEKEKAKINTKDDRDLLKILAPMEDQRKYTAVWFGDGGRIGADGAPERRVTWGAVVVWKTSNVMMRNYHLGALHPECDIQHGELTQIYKSTEFGLELLRQGHPVRMLCGSDSQTCADDVEAARSARNHRDLHDYDASIMIETIVNNIMEIEAQGGIWDLFRVPGHSYTPNVIADALATAAQRCSSFSQEINMKTDRAFVVLCDRDEAQPFWLQHDKGAKMFRYLRIRGQRRKVERELREYITKHAKVLTAQLKHEDAHNLKEIIKAKLRSRFGRPASKDEIEHQAQAQVQVQMELERQSTQDKLDAIIYPILNYVAIPNLHVKTDAPRWSTAVELFVAEPKYTTSRTRFDVSTQFANFALRTDMSVVPGLATCPLCKRDVSPTAWHLITECTLKTRELEMPVLPPPRVPLTATASDLPSSDDDDDATEASAQVARGTDAYLAQELEHILRHYRPESQWHIELTQPNDQNVFLRELELTCDTLILSCRDRQHDDDRSTPRALSQDGEIAKFNTLRFLACHLPHDPLASIFRTPMDEDGHVPEEEAEEIRTQRKAFFQVWLRIHQLVAQAITQVKYKYNRMNAANRAAAREEDAPQFRDANTYKVNQATPERNEQAEAQRGNRTERNERRSSTDLLELNRKNEMQKKGNHINPTVATSQIGYLTQKRIDEHTTYEAPFAIPSTLTQAERMSRWPRSQEDQEQPEAAEEEKEPGEAMDTGSMRNSSKLSQEGHDPYEADDDSSRRESAGGSLIGSRAVAPPPSTWETDGGMKGTSGLQDGNEDKSSDGGPSGRGSSKGGNNEPHGGDGGKGSSSGHQGSDKSKGSNSGQHGNDDGRDSDSRLSGKGGSNRGGSKGNSKGGSNELHGGRSCQGGSSGQPGRSKGKSGSSEHHGGRSYQGGSSGQLGRGKGKSGSNELHDGNGSQGGSSGLDDDGSSSTGSRSSHHSAKNSSRKKIKKQKRANQQRESSNDNSAAQRPASDARAEQPGKKQKQQ